MTDKELDKIAEKAFNYCFDFKIFKPKEYDQKSLKHDIKEAIKEGIDIYKLNQIK